MAKGGIGDDEKRGKKGASFFFLRHWDEAPFFDERKRMVLVSYAYI